MNRGNTGIGKGTQTTQKAQNIAEGLMNICVSLRFLRRLRSFIPTEGEQSCCDVVY
nr:hypothetical protein [Parabacteroides goldsteinii]